MLAIELLRHRCDPLGERAHGGAQKFALVGEVEVHYDLEATGELRVEEPNLR